MVIAEVKFRPPPDWRKFIDSRQVREVYGVSPVMAIRPGGPRGARDNRNRRSTPPPTDSLHAELAGMIEQTNDNMAALGLEFHLSLLKKGTTFVLEVYDCTSGRFCEEIGSKEVSIADLPGLLRNLHERAGLLLDVQS